jgi:phosphate transport system substrate-binding protein
MKLSRSLKIAAAAAAVTLFAAQPAFAGTSITGSGSTFAGSLISACTPGFQTSSGNTVSYAGGGSGTGRNNADRGINDFNFSDVPFSGASSSLLHIPVVAAPVGIGYNLSSGSAKSATQPQLYFSQKTLSDIFAGKVTMWNDAEIAADNNKTISHTVVTTTLKKDAKGKTVLDKMKKPVKITTSKTVTEPSIVLPAQPIRVVYRSDSSGTTQNLVNFFQQQFPDVWGGKTSGGNGLFVSGVFSNSFPGGGAGNAGVIPASFLSAAGSSGVSALAASTPYSINYVESGYAKAVGLGLANIKNASGAYVAPTAGGVSAFLSAASVSSAGVLTYNFNTTEPGAYVLGIVSYGLVNPKAISSASNLSATQAFFKYLLTDACVNANPDLGFSTISGQVLTTVNGLIAKLQ